MSALHVIGRGLLGGYFVGQGVMGLRATSERVAAAEPAVQRLLDWVDRFAPEPCQRYLPRQTTTYVRLHALLDLIGGAMLASGVGRRFGALCLVKAQLLRLIPATPTLAALTDPERGRDLALLGAALSAALDTGGKPSLAWRATHRPAANRTGRQTKTSGVTR